jgi:UDP-N-acetylmuramate dehydrogenase
MAGARLSTVCRIASEQGLSGLEMALGIPGTVGGAVRMNAGTKEGAVGDVVCSVSFLLPDGRVETVPRNELDFRYRELRGLRGALILGAHFGLRKNGASPEELKARSKAILEERRKRQPAPVQGWSAGCFFKNPPGAPPAGALIDRAGLKGARIGGAMVSPRHANFILNTGKATAGDILALKAHIQETVYRQFGIELSPEVEIVGEKRPEA